MTGARIKEVRKHFNLSQTEFGEKIGLTRPTIANIELDRIKISEAYIKLICQTFNVNPLWLENGTGDMLIETEQSLFENVASAYNLTKLEKSIIKKFVSLDKSDRKVILDFILSLSETESSSDNNVKTIHVVEAARTKDNSESIKATQISEDELKIFDTAQQVTDEP